MVGTYVDSDQPLDMMDHPIAVKGSSCNWGGVAEKVHRIREGPVLVYSAGYAMPLNLYPFGAGDGQRCSARTKTIRANIMFYAELDESLMVYPQEVNVHHYLLSSRRGMSALPRPSDIFEGSTPWLYRIRPELEEDVSLLGTIVQSLSSTGVTGTEAEKGNPPHACDSKRMDCGCDGVISHHNMICHGVVSDLGDGVLLLVSVVTSSIPNQSEVKTLVKMSYSCNIIFHDI